MDRLTPEARSALMSRIRSKDTSPELAVRRLLHSLGYRFRLHRRDLPGAPDIVLPGRRAAIFVHGCFWHGHGCNIGQPAKSRLDYWGPKIETNRARDARRIAALRRAGWRVAVIWECKVRRGTGLAARLVRFVGPRG